MNDTNLSKISDAVCHKIRPYFTKDWFLEDIYAAMAYKGFMFFLDELILVLADTLLTMEQNDAIEYIYKMQYNHLEKESPELRLKHLIYDPAKDAADMVYGEIYTTALNANNFEYIVNKKKYIDKFKKLELELKQYKPLPWNQEYFEQKCYKIEEIIYHNYKPKKNHSPGYME